MNMMTKYDALTEIIEDLQLQVKPTTTGHIRTAISVLKEEQHKLRQQMEAALEGA